MKKRIIKTALFAAAAVTAVATAPALAAPPSGPSGSIEVASDSASARTADAGLQYDGTVAFNTAIDGKISKHARIYVTVVCRQGDAVVYQYSANPDFSFPLTDQAGQGLDWNGEDASCEAWLIHRVQKGKGTEINLLDTTSFLVAGVPA